MAAPVSPHNLGRKFFLRFDGLGFGRFFFLFLSARRPFNSVNCERLPCQLRCSPSPGCDAREKPRPGMARRSGKIHSDPSWSPHPIPKLAILVVRALFPLLFSFFRSAPLTSLPTISQRFFFSIVSSFDHVWPPLLSVRGCWRIDSLEAGLVGQINMPMRLAVSIWSPFHRL